VDDTSSSVLLIFPQQIFLPERGVPKKPTCLLASPLDPPNWYPQLKRDTPSLARGKTKSLREILWMMSLLLACYFLHEKVEKQLRQYPADISTRKNLGRRWVLSIQPVLGDIDRKHQIRELN
jgi:hypothetical protein